MPLKFRHHAETEAVRQEARERHAREDAGGKPTAIATTIPLNASTADLKQYSAEQIRGWMKRRRAAGYSV
jgi:hypothetical protein